MIEIDAKVTANVTINPANWSHVNDLRIAVENAVIRALGELGHSVSVTVEPGFANPCPF